MRGLIILAVVVLLLALVGWISFNNDPGEASITIEKDAIREDTQDVLNKSEDLIDRAQTETPNDNRE